MSWETIKKAVNADSVEPNLKHYDDVRATFSWDVARANWMACPMARG